MEGRSLTEQESKIENKNEIILKKEKKKTKWKRKGQNIFENCIIDECLLIRAFVFRLATRKVLNGWA